MFFAALICSRRCREEAITSELVDLVTAFEALTEAAEQGPGTSE